MRFWNQELLVWIREMPLWDWRMFLWGRKNTGRVSAYQRRGFQAVSMRHLQWDCEHKISAQDLQHWNPQKNWFSGRVRLFRARKGSGNRLKSKKIENKRSICLYLFCLLLGSSWWPQDGPCDSLDRKTNPTTMNFFVKSAHVRHEFDDGNYLELKISLRALIWTIMVSTALLGCSFMTRSTSMDGPWPGPWLALGLTLAGLRPDPSWPLAWPLAWPWILSVFLFWSSFDMKDRIPQDRQGSLTVPTRDLGMQSDSMS